MNLTASFPVALAALALAVPSAARANPRPLPFSYPYETLHPEAVGVEQSMDARSPIVVDDFGRRTWDPQFRLQTEYEYGISEKVEIGVFMVMSSSPGQSVYFEGMKQRVRMRFAEANQWPVDVGLNLEVLEFRNTLAFEERLVLQKGWKGVRFISNTSIEEEFENYQTAFAFIVSQTAGIALELSDHVTLGAEYWMRRGLKRAGGEEHGEAKEAPEFEAIEVDPDVGFQSIHFLGPTLTFGWHRFWWTTAAYVRLDSHGPVTDLQTERLIADPYGRVWVRTVVGLGL